MHGLNYSGHSSGARVGNGVPCGLVAGFFLRSQAESNKTRISKRVASLFLMGLAWEVAILVAVAETVFLILLLALAVFLSLFGL